MNNPLQHDWPRRAGKGDAGPGTSAAPGAAPAAVNPVVVLLQRIADLLEEERRRRPSKGTARSSQHPSIAGTAEMIYETSDRPVAVILSSDAAASSVFKFAQDGIGVNLPANTLVTLELPPYTQLWGNSATALNLMAAIIEHVPG